MTIVFYRLCPNQTNPKDGRKAPEVLFERESFYLWNVSLKKGDLSYVMSENDKYFVEVTDLVGKEKKNWQARLGSANIPKFIATIVYVGGGRPKVDRINEDILSNSNLMQWLKKRKMDVKLFERLISGDLPPKLDKGDDVLSTAYTNGAGKDKSPFKNPSIPPAYPRPQLFNQPPHNSNSFHANFVKQALSLTQRTMMLQTPEDPEVQNLIADDADAQLAIFLSKTWTNAVMLYRQNGPAAANPGPIGPPRAQGGRGLEMNEFYADGGVGRAGARNEGLYGLPRPLLDYHANAGGSMEPPYKRKFEDW